MQDGWNASMHSIHVNIRCRVPYSLHFGQKSTFSRTHISTLLLACFVDISDGGSSFYLVVCFVFHRLPLLPFCYYGLYSVLKTQYALNVILTTVVDISFIAWLTISVPFFLV